MAPKALLYQFCVFFINKECQWLYKKMQVASILKWLVIVRESSSRLEILSGLPPLFLIDMFHAIGGSFDN